MISLQNLRKIHVDESTVRRPEQPLEINLRSADGRHREMSTIESGEDAEQEGHEECTMIVKTNATVDPTKHVTLYFMQFSTNTLDRQLPDGG